MEMNKSRRIFYVLAAVAGLIGIFPVKFFLEEVLFEELLGVSDVLYSLYPFSLLFLYLISALFYGHIIWLFWRGLKYKEWKFFIVLVFETIIVLFAMIYAFQVAFSNAQCDTKLSSEERFLFKRGCYLGISPRPGLYDIAELILNSGDTNYPMSKNDLEVLQFHKGSIEYFCNTGCQAEELSCRYQFNDTACVSCVQQCENDYDSDLRKIHNPSMQPPVYADDKDILNLKKELLGCVNACK